MRGDIDTGWIQRFAEVAKRNRGNDGSGVIAVEGCPPAVRALHAERPSHGSLDGLLNPRAQRFVAMFLELRQHEQRDGCVIDIGIKNIGALECPAARQEILGANRPIAMHEDLTIEHPLQGPAHGGHVSHPSSSLGERQKAQQRIPHR